MQPKETITTTTPHIPWNTRNHGNDAALKQYTECAKVNCFLFRLAIVSAKAQFCSCPSAITILQVKDEAFANRSRPDFVGKAF